MRRAEKISKKQPLVSVCMSAYNHELYVARALDSVLAQTYQNIEIIIVDDASTDSTAAIIRKYAQRYPGCVKAIFLAQNEGPCLAGNRTYAAASGEFIAFLGTDDCMLPLRIEKQVEFLLNNLDHIVVFSNVAIIDANGNRVPGGGGLERLFNQKVSNIYRRFLSGNFLNAPSALVRKLDLLEVGGSSPLLRYVQDYDLWVKLLLRGKLSKLNEVLTEYRVHGKNLSISQKPSYATRCEMVAVIVSLVDKFPLQVFFDRPLDTPQEQVAATLELVEILKNVDRNYLQRAGMGSALAYRLILQASWIDPRKCQAAKQDLEAFMECGAVPLLEVPAVRHLPNQDIRSVGVIIHVSCIEALVSILKFLKGIEGQIYLYVTCLSEYLKEVANLLAAADRPHLLISVDNCGRDVLPFLQVLNYLKHDGVELFLKLHAQGISSSLGLADEIQEAIYYRLLNPSAFYLSVKRFTDEVDLQLIGPDGFLSPVSQGLRDDTHKKLQELSLRAELAVEKVFCGEFVIGGMFFGKFRGFEPLLNLGLTRDDFASELELEHDALVLAMERFFLVFAEAQQAQDPAVLYRRWLNTRKLSKNDSNGLAARLSGWPTQPQILLVVDDVCSDERLLSRTLSYLREQLYRSFITVVFSNNKVIDAELSGRLRWLPRSPDLAKQINEVISQSAVDWFYLLRAGDILDPHGLLLLAERIVNDTDMLCCYSDEDCIAGGQASFEAPVFKPDFNLDMLRSYPYVGRTLAFQRQSFLDLGGFQQCFQDLAPHDLLFRLVESRGLLSIGHIAEVLVHQYEHLGQWLLEEGVVLQVAPMVAAHLSRLNVPHSIGPGVLRMINRVTYRFTGLPLVSIIIQAKSSLNMLRRCVESLLAITQYKYYEVIIVDAVIEDQDTAIWLSEVESLGNSKLRVLRYPHVPNSSAINNFAMQHASGEYLLFLSHETAVVDGDWLDMLLNHARRPEVGIVGARLHYSDGRIQHAGMVLGLRGVADNAYIGEEKDAKGYMQRLQIDQNYSAVSAACLMIRKTAYEEVHGMDSEHFAVSYGDVDLCLKVSNAGYLIVWTPYAALLHESSDDLHRIATRPRLSVKVQAGNNPSQDQVAPTNTAEVERLYVEQGGMYGKWLARLAHDPAYNKNLNLDGKGFAHDYRTEIGWQPFIQRQRPFVLARVADLFGCGHYRMIKPLAAMSGAGLVDGSDCARLYSLPELSRIAPDSVIFQRQLLEPQFEALCNIKAYSQSFKVFELDDYLIDLPIKSVHRAHMPKDIDQLLRRAVAQCDRFVVSSEVLAEAFKDLHSNFCVVENRLPLEWWANAAAQAKRRVGRKPRVGWAGGISHTGDLELIADVVRELAGQVEWVFFGMCPDVLRPYIHEFHSGVHIELYPAKLASLNLDLALAPLEDNLFNRCKSNLRLLEYGICGFPVICSDNLCYRGDLPVVRVQNRTDDWLQAIRMHLADLDATARAGDVLYDAVRRDWMLEGKHLERWCSAWLAD